jgi:hypothetical protein
LFTFTLIGDLIGSRRNPDRGALQQALGKVLDRVNDTIATDQILEPTVGDEIQGAFPTIGAATLATLLIRLELAPHVGMRFGLGYGSVTVYDGSRRPLLQDGPGWWNARKAITSGRERQRGACYEGPEDNEDAPDPAFVNAFLIARDGLFQRLSSRQRRMLLSTLSGQTQIEIAEAEGISESAVSQAFARGVSAVRDAQRTLSLT